MGFSKRILHYLKENADGNMPFTINGMRENGWGISKILFRILLESCRSIPYSGLQKSKVLYLPDSVLVTAFSGA